MFFSLLPLTSDDYSFLIHKLISVNFPAAWPQRYRISSPRLQDWLAVFFPGLLPSDFIFIPHSTPNNSFVSISSIHLINASAICQLSPVSFNSMFSGLEFSKEIEKQKTKGGEGRFAWIEKQESSRSPQSTPSEPENRLQLCSLRHGTSENGDCPPKSTLPCLI